MPMIGDRLEHSGVPDLMEPIVGVRGWELDYWQSGFRLGSYTSGLRSISQSYTWKREEEATCVWSDALNEELQLVRPNMSTALYKSLYSQLCQKKRLHQAPASTCSCGLYAFHTLASLGQIYPHAPIAGVVQAWGNCEIHEDGIRAEWMRICAIAPTPEWTRAVQASINPLQRWKYHRWLRDIAASYDVPLIEYSELESRMTEWGRRANKLWAGAS